MDEAIKPPACQACGQPVRPGAKFCSDCGQLLDAPQRRAAPPSKWYYNIWVTLFMLFCVLGPFGLPLVWKNPRLSQPIKIVLTVLTVMYTLVLVNVTIQAIRAVTNEVQQFNATL